MPNKVYIIGCNYLRGNSELGDNIEDKFLFRSTLTAQDIDIQNLLGTELYDLVLTECYNKSIDKTGYTMTSRILTLVEDYIVPTLLYSVLRDCIPFLYFKLTPAAASVNDNNTNQNQTEYKILSLFRKEYESKYGHYSTRLTNHLTENITLFPEWAYLNTSGEKQNVTPIKDRTYFGGLQLDSDNYHHKNDGRNYDSYM